MNNTQGPFKTYFPFSSPWIREEVLTIPYTVETFWAAAMLLKDAQKREKLAILIHDYYSVCNSETKKYLKKVSYDNAKSE